LDMRDKPFLCRHTEWLSIWNAPHQDSSSVEVMYLLDCVLFKVVEFELGHGCQ